MPSLFDRFVGAMWPEFQALTERVDRMAISQEQSDAALKVIGDALAEIEKDIAELKAGAEVGVPMSQDTYDKIVALGTRAAAAGKLHEPEPPAEEV